MIKSFKCRDTANLFNNKSVLRFQGIERTARKGLFYLNAVLSLNEIGRIPGNCLEALKGNRKGQYSVLINDQWRICFRWVDGNPHDVETVDFH